MNSTEKNAIEKHLLKASGLGEKSVGYKAIQRLFRLGELDFMMNNRALVLDIRRGCMTLGLDCEMRWNKIVLDDFALKNYYENVMGLKAESVEEKSYYERRKET